MELDPVSSNLDGEEKKTRRKRGREDEESDKKKKKRKKEKPSDASSDPASVDSTIDPQEVAYPSVATGTTAATPTTKEKEKRKKNKSSAKTCDPPSTIEPVPSAGVAEESEKPRKRKSTKGDTIDVGVDAGASSKPKPKSQNRKKGETAEGEDNPSVVAPTEDPPRKRKKSRKSAHPDPSDDPHLTEQSQKALIYVYSQSTSPEAWKFNKARQNWIIRNVWTPKVPEKYLPMVVEYLFKVQGKARETLIESCKKVISGVKSEPSAESNEKGPSENQNPPAHNAVGSEKIQGANTLLHALAKES